jgi:hypothetical protein
MTSAKYIGVDIQKESISIAVMNSVGRIVMECVIETKASTILQFIDGLRGDSASEYTDSDSILLTFSYLTKYSIQTSISCKAFKAGVSDQGETMRTLARGYEMKGSANVHLGHASILALDRNGLGRVPLSRHSGRHINFDEE